MTTQPACRRWSAWTGPSSLTSSKQLLEAVDRQTIRMFGRLSGMEFISIKEMKYNLQGIDITQ